MVKNGKHIIQLVEDSLRNTINEVISANQSGEIHFKRVVFSGEHNLVVVEIGQDQRHNLPESFFANNTTRKALLAHSNCSKVDVLDLGESTLIYFWTTSNEQGERTEALNLAYAIP